MSVARSLGGAEVDAGGAQRVAPDVPDVDAAVGDGGQQVVAEAVGADPGDPAGGVAGAGEGAGDVGFGTADGAVEGGDIGEPPGQAGQEGDHGLAEADDIDVRDGCAVRGLTVMRRSRTWSRADVLLRCTAHPGAAGAAVRVSSGAVSRARSGPFPAMLLTIDRAMARMLDSGTRYAQ